ncbi:MAG TPA: NAD(P)H-binding protein [Allosphingosinicella sp.]|nr:NAD(P)H-binding protein [Allosphingosinicella sp.]
MSSDRRLSTCGGWRPIPSREAAPLRLVLIGATGLVGSLLADRLLAGEAVVHALVRRPSGRTHERWHEHVAPSADWPGLAAGLAVDAAVSALGTTMRSAGSQAAFRAVDLETVVAFAAAARWAGARRMVTVSSVGADPGSRNFYLRTKGEMERALEGLGFDRLDVLRPGLLRGKRGGERRLGERIGIALSPVVNLVLRGRLDRFAAIDAEIVAEAAAGLLRRSEPGTYRHENRSIRALADAD